MALPRSLTPMLAQFGEPFDSDDYLFEIKWDGVRTLLFVDEEGYRLVNRRHVDMTARYPEFDFLATLPAGTVLDGEMVVLKDGKPDFGLLQSRDHSQSARKVLDLARTMPATLVVFDQLFDRYENLMSRPLVERRERLGQLVRSVNSPRLVLSEGVVGSGKAFFQEACAHGLEGMVAKRLSSTYQPGRRNDAWIKIKRGGEMVCLVIGFVPSGKKDFRSLLLATEEGGKLRYAGKVGTGFSDKTRERIRQLLFATLRSKPVVPCKIRGKWIEPGIYCKVSYMERTQNGEFRAPVFEELYLEPCHG